MAAMPLINVFTSAEPPAPEAADSLLKDLSARLAQHTGKPETYVMTCLVPRTRMTFGGSDEPTCLVEVKSIGRMEPVRTETMSADFCERLSKALGVAPDRIYIDFTDVSPHLWGWNGSTFG